MAETQEPVMATTEAKEPVMATRDYEISPFDDFVNQILQGNPLTVGILFSVIVVFLTIVWFIFRGSSQRRSTILLMGPCDAGKTLMFLRLVYKHFALTYTSVKENKGHFIAKIKDKILTVVDTPGHERLRSQYIEEYGPHALGIVFVIDSSTISRKTVADVAEYLYTILADPIISRNRPRVLVACNKQDQSMLAKRHTAVKSMMGEYS
jgi:signal recognition particle receptor subunit beta